MSRLCPDCGRDFKGEPMKYYDHMRSRKNKTCEAEFFSCECPGIQQVNSNGKPYSRRRFLWRKYIHMKIIHMGFLGCVSPNCLNVFEKEEDLENHKTKVHHKEGGFYSKYVCGKCGREFNKFLETRVKNKFDNHMRQHQAEEDSRKKYNCVECGKVFNKFTEIGVRKKFDKHMRIHKVWGFQCDCPNIPNVIVSETGLKGARIGGYFLIKEKHMMVQHENKYSCEDCIKYFETDEELTHHRLSHVTVLCRSCSKKVSRKRMADHMRQHEVDPCQCLTCGKSFPNNHFLEKSYENSYK